MKEVTAQGLAQRNLQRERQQRGTDFQEEIRSSWRQVPNCWRMTIESGKGQGQSSGTRPADAITILNDVNVLTELKRTSGEAFELGFLRPNQLEGLIDFDAVIPRNFGLVFVSFLNEERGIDAAYSIRLIDAIKFMKRVGRQHIKLEELRRGAVACLHLPVTWYKGHRLYDLQGVNDYYSGYRK